MLDSNDDLDVVFTNHDRLDWVWIGNSNFTRYTYDPLDDKHTHEYLANPITAYNNYVWLSKQDAMITSFALTSTVGVIISVAYREGKIRFALKKAKERKNRRND